MIRVTFEQIKNKLEQSTSLLYFIAIGSDPYLQHMTQHEINIQLKSWGFEEKIVFSIDNQTDWDAIYASSQSMSLFSSKTLIQLQFGDNSLNAAIANKLNELTEVLSPDIALYISLAKMTKAQENTEWFKALSQKLMVINCTTPDINQLQLWLKSQLKQNDLELEKQSIDLLCYYYEGNLLALSQTLEQLKLLFPTSKISYDQLEQQINDAAVFTPYHWIDAMLSGKIKRAIHILQQLEQNDLEPLILLRTVQREIILLINIKKLAIQQPLRVAYDTLKVWQNRRNLLTPYLEQTSLNQLYQSLKQLTELEIIAKRDYHVSVWQHLSSLTVQFCGKKK